MKLWRWLAVLALGTNGGLLTFQAAQANPIVPQAGTPTQVQQTGSEFTITGGVHSADGQALFHAFEQLGLSQGQIATFLAQPEVHSILSSVVGGDASYIDGLLRVTGGAADLYLINPAGILFGPNAQLDLPGALAATTATGVLFDGELFNVLDDDDFSQISGMPTGFVFAVDEAGAIVNVADLAVATGEAIALIGGQVITTGSLTAPGGEITIAAIPEAGLVRLSHPDMVLNLEIATLPTGAIADGRTMTPLTLPALLTGAPADMATGLTVQPDGTVALTGSMTVLPPTAGSAIASGTVNVSGSQGGSIAVVGDRVALLNATVTADSATGGGTVRVGGDYQGQPTLPGATLTYVDAESQITADAGGSGDGGQVIFWANGTTAFYGDIRANGGVNSGDGGFVEVSGAETLIYRGTVRAIAPNGAAGTLLLDPTDINILNGTNDGDDTPDVNPLNLSPLDVLAAAATPTTIYESELENTAGNVNVILRATNNITLGDLADNALTFNSDPVTPGSITFEAGNEFRFVDPNDAIVAPRRNLTINAATITVGTLDTSEVGSFGGNVTLNASGAIAISGINTLGDALGGGGSGDVTITGSQIQTGRIRAGGGFLNDSRVALTATSGDIIVDTITAGGGGLEIDAARRFQARDTFDSFVRITLNSTDDAALIDFLMRGNPQPLIDAGLVDTADQVFITFPTSIGVNPGGGQPGNIVIRHGGSAARNFSDGNITITGSGAFPNIQFVSGPNDDHTIDIDPGIPDASFTGFTTLFPPGTFPAEASGTIGAILRGQGDATLVTSFQNQPFVPLPEAPESGGPAGNIPGTPGTEAGVRGIDVEARSFERLSNLTPDYEDDDALTSEADADAIATDEVEDEDCVAAIVRRSGNTVEIDSTCPVPIPADLTD
ncbi:filamentous hemagglutinin N-terminal domain-containing protein [Halomicronema sp. CCY15110]|uniref:two-partner secretion domain-containing protein n=1 Tax=Halomicronema sp. CCY15110 TaxID=2767773 RepID=UPI0019523C4E|nr:filamentous hemagglutinin N-terminal domain-containing protein [Halomicronema sp. CCY15110]